MPVDDVASALPKPDKMLVLAFVRPPERAVAGRSPELDVPRDRKSSIINGSHAITPEVALLLEQRFGIGAELWMNMQAASVLPEAGDEKDV
jgi:addiction module HigA family antidote